MEDRVAFPRETASTPTQRQAADCRAEIAYFCQGFLEECKRPAGWIEDDIRAKYII